MSLSVQVISCFSTFLVFVLDPLFSLSIFCSVLMPHMDQKGKHRNTPLTQGDNKNIHDNSSQGRGENKRYTNQSIQLHNKNYKAPSHSTQRTKPLGEHVHTTARTRAHTGSQDLPLAGGVALKG